MPVTEDNSQILAALARIKQVLGPQGWINDPDAAAPFLADERGMFEGACALVVRPSSTAQVAKIVGICAQAGIPVVPQGGNTGLVGAGIPNPADGAVLVSLGRMNRILDIDPLGYTITLEAGCILANIQAAAAKVDRMFPLSLGAEGTCQIGGNLSTNAGGVNVLRYGNARELVLGLEVVLPDGRVWDGLKRLRKDNTGYDLKQLYIGGEGTLGIITAAVCKLYPRPRDVQTAMVALAGLDAALALLARARDASGDRVTGFELICRTPFAAAITHIPGVRDPLAQQYDAYVLFELTGASADSGMKDTLESILAEALESGEIHDAVIAQSDAQRADFWRLREAVVEAQKFEGPSVKHDVSVAVSRVPAFIRRANAAMEKIVPGARPFAFGHFGDGNIHYNIAGPRGMADAKFLAMRAPVTAAIYDIIVDMGGSFSAEHGVGQLKLDEMARYKNPLELDMMRRVKAALDPANIMNPGKMLKTSQERTKP
ncbi:MAG: putative FAD-linked oxidoreductase [Alphaproteobacteria bacterium MarineAlpha10_Bin3]|nr:MAG: putative FAD-linked oxidoreductase [Alphaproteobacteria bacterium MarineAlpha10_Bin3]PPR70055.1 MAG: putative FAD-linked oxidoreductase [Alphaproteobacteria bacterium MarineAlpha4_Bin1]